MRFALATVAAFLLIVAPAAAGELVVGESIRGVAVGESRADVTQRLGRPLATRVRGTPLGRARILGFERLVVTLLEGRVVAVRTTAVRDVTAGGIGVGSTRRAVARRVDGARCKPRRCRVGRRRHGRVLTQFAIRRGRVSSVLVARVLGRKR